MGTASTTKFIKNSSGQLTEQAALTTSAGAGDAQALVALNASGVLDASIVNSKASSAGAGDAGKVVALDGSGRIDNTMMPVGIGADTATITASEALSAGDFVNILELQRCQGPQGRCHHCRQGSPRLCAGRCEQWRGGDGVL